MPQTLLIARLDDAKLAKVKFQTLGKGLGEPTSVWKVEGGYFGAFDKGEFGGYFCFAGEQDKTWIPLKTAKGDYDAVYISQLVKLNDSEFLAAGGLAHMSLEIGGIYKIKVVRGVAKMEFITGSTTNAGIPKIVGQSHDPLNIGNKLVVYSVSGGSNENEELYGVSNDGKTYHLGKYSRKLSERRKAVFPNPFAEEVVDGKPLPDVSPESPAFEVIEQDELLVVIRGRDIPQIYMPFTYQKGKFPKDRLLAELKEIEGYMSHLEIEAPKFWKEIKKKKQFTKAELVAVVRFGRMIKAEVLLKGLEKGLEKE